MGSYAEKKLLNQICLISSLIYLYKLNVRFVETTSLGCVINAFSAGVWSLPPLIKLPNVDAEKGGGGKRDMGGGGGG